MTSVRPVESYLIKVGDRVRVHEGWPVRGAVEGEVIQIQRGCVYKVRTSAGEELYFSRVSLELVDSQTESEV